MSVRAWLFLASASALLSGCYDPSEGVDPPLSAFYFPVGLAQSPGATRLYVANSDFDLQFNGGSLQALDLERVRSLVPRPCKGDTDCDTGTRCDTAPTAANDGMPSGWCVAEDGPHAGEPCGVLGEKTAAGRLIAPGRCRHVTPTKPEDGGSPLVVGAVGIAAFATDMIYRARPSGPGGRLFIPSRGDATLHYVEVIDDTEPETVPFELECGQSGNEGNCDDRHRVGDDPEEENTRDQRLPPEPFGIAALDDAEAIVLTHQTEGAASLFVSDEGAWGDGVNSFGGGPKFEFVLGGLPSRPIGVAAIPEPAIVETDPTIAYEPGFLVTFRNSPEVRLLRYFSDEAASPERPFLQDAGAVGIGTNSVSTDSRGIAIDASERQACEAACAAGNVDCLKQCAGIQLGVYVANRTPTSVLVGRTRTNNSVTASDDLPSFFDSVVMNFGPSRVVIGDVVNGLGARVPRVFVLCFDARKIFVFDPELKRVETTIHTGRGPHALSIDVGPDHAYGYVAHFTDSYIGVIDLDQRNATFGTIVLTVGKPTAPRASK